ncbi:MAG: hypothetical protein HY801_15300 [Candidatus Lindowbacteria bacterium]|nr:hypothetical protein [Candidatus Lindowbacteria bacterium]
MTKAYLRTETVEEIEGSPISCESFGVRCGTCVSWYRVKPANTLIGICENVLSEHCEHVLAARHVACEHFEARPLELDEEEAK